MPKKPTNTTFYEKARAKHVLELKDLDVYEQLLCRKSGALRRCS